MSIVQRAVIAAEGLWVQHRVTLDPEPPGVRQGLVTARPDRPIALVGVGDSMIAGCGVEHTSQSLMPRVAQHFTERTGQSVRWRAHGKLGATMRRVRYRLLEEAGAGIDVLVLCAGSNDILAGRTRDEWCEDLAAVLDDAQRRASHVLLCSSGQPHHSPAVPPTLAREFERRIDAQTADSIELCRARGIRYVDLAHVDLFPGFWAHDHFHPGPAGYEFAATRIADVLASDFEAARSR